MKAGAQSRAARLRAAAVRVQQVADAGADASVVLPARWRRVGQRRSRASAGAGDGGSCALLMPHNLARFEPDAACTRPHAFQAALTPL